MHQQKLTACSLNHYVEGTAEDMDLSKKWYQLLGSFTLSVEMDYIQTDGLYT